MFRDLKKLRNSNFLRTVKGFAFVTLFWEYLCTAKFYWATAGATDVWSEQGFMVWLEVLILCVIDSTFLKFLMYIYKLEGILTFKGLHAFSVDQCVRFRDTYY